MFKSLLGLAGDLAKLTVAPIEIAVDITRIATKPLADIAEATVEDVKFVVKELTE